MHGCDWEGRPCVALKMGMAPFTTAILLLLVGIDGMPVIMPNGERKQPFIRGDVSIHDTMKAFENLQVPFPKDVPPDFFCHSCQEVSRKAEKFLSDPNLYDQANNLSTEVCQIMHSNLQIKCRRLVELYLHEGILFLQIAFSEKNLCNSTGFCPVGDSKVPSSTSHGRRGFLSIDPNFVLHLGKQLLAQLQSKFLSVIQYAPLKAKIKSRTCNACHTFADQLCRELEDHDQQIVIMEALLDVCEAFKVYAAKCKVWVFEYGPLFLANLHKFLMAQDLCQIIHMCAEPVPPIKETEHLFLRRKEYTSRQLHYPLSNDIAL